MWKWYEKAGVDRPRLQWHALSEPIHQNAERWIKKFERGKLTALSALKKQLETRGE